MIEENQNPDNNPEDGLPTLDGLSISKQFYLHNIEKELDNLNRDQAIRMCKYYLRHHLIQEEAYKTLLKEYMLPKHN